MDKAIITSEQAKAILAEALKAGMSAGVYLRMVANSPLTTPKAAL